LVYFLDCKCNY